MGTRPSVCHRPPESAIRELIVEPRPRLTPSATANGLHIEWVGQNGLHKASDGRCSSIGARDCGKSVDLPLRLRRAGSDKYAVSVGQFGEKRLTGPFGCEPTTQFLDQLTIANSARFLLALLDLGER